MLYRRTELHVSDPIELVTSAEREGWVPDADTAGADLLEENFIEDILGDLTPLQVADLCADTAHWFGDDIEHYAHVTAVYTGAEYQED